MKQIDCEKLAGLFKALSHPLRTKIVAGLVKKDECNVNKMVEVLGVSQPVVSQHLTVLKSAGIIEGYRKGNQICYKVVDDTVRQLLNAIEKSM